MKAMNRSMVAAVIVGLAAVALTPSADRTTQAQTPAEQQTMISELLENRPLGKRKLAEVKLPEAFSGRSSEEGVVDTDHGQAVFRDQFAEQGDMVLCVRRFFAPVKLWEVKNPQQILDGARDNNLGDGTELELKQERNFEIEGCPGRSFTFRDKESSDLLRMDYLLVYPDLHVLQYAGPAAGLQREDVQQGEHPVLVEQHEADHDHATGEKVGDVEGEAGDHHTPRDTNKSRVARKPSISAAPRKSPTRNTRILAIVTSNAANATASRASLTR